MRRFVCFIVLLPVRIVLLPVELALILIGWIGIFVTSMSAWIFNLISTIMFALVLFSRITGTMPVHMFWKSMGVAFVIFIIPYVAEWIVLRIIDLRYLIRNIIFM